MTTLQFIDAHGQQEINAAAFVLNGKSLLAIDEQGHKSCVAVWRGTDWLVSAGRRSQLRFVGDSLSVRFDDGDVKGELVRARSLRLTGSRGHQPRLGDVVELAEGLWRARDTSRAVGRLVIASMPYRLAA